jgi:hypothetical protein
MLTAMDLMRLKYARDRPYRKALPAEPPKPLRYRLYSVSDLHSNHSPGRKGEHQSIIGAGQAVLVTLRYLEVAHSIRGR